MSAEQRTLAWRMERLGKVTASEMSAVMAKGRSGGPSITREKYMARLITETLTGQLHEGYSSAAMDHGAEFEDLARAAYEARTQIMVERCGFIPHPTITQSGASPDGLGDTGGLVELKCPETHTHIRWMLAGKPPTEHLQQMGWECACAARPWVDFVSFDPRLPKSMQLFIVRFTPTPQYLAELTVGVREFLDEMNATIASLEKVAA